MSRNLILFIAVFFLMFRPTAALAQQIEAEALRDLLRESGATVACLISGENNRRQRNVVVWSQGGSLGALVYRADITRNVPFAPPCWGSSGHCAIFDGDLSAASTLCETSVGMSGTNVALSEEEVAGSIRPTILQRDGGSSLAPALETISTNLMPLAHGLSGNETWVSLLNGHQVYMAEGERGTRQTRIELSGGPVTIARLRVAYETLDLTALENAIAALGTRDLALVGPDGALSADGRAYIDGQCFAVAQPNLLRDRLIAANTAFALEAPPDGAGAAAAFDDVVQGMLGGEPAYGAPITLVPEQDPRLLLYLPGQTDICP